MAKKRQSFSKDFKTKVVLEACYNNIRGIFLVLEIIQAFKTFRDQVIFTNKRIISIDVQGITGKRKSFSTLPYSTIQFFEIQTQGFIEIFPDNELFIQYANGFTAQFEFKGNVDICKIGKIISQYVLK